MQQSEAQQFKVKVLMIREYESIMSEKKKQNEVWFPNFLIVRKPISEGKDALGND
jgi:hypothetical protein